MPVAAHPARPAAMIGIRAAVVGPRLVANQTRFPTQTRNYRPSKRRSEPSGLVSTRHELEQTISKEIPAHIGNSAAELIANGVRSGEVCEKFFRRASEKRLFLKP